VLENGDQLEFEVNRSENSLLRTNLLLFKVISLNSSDNFGLNL